MQTDNKLPWKFITIVSVLILVSGVWRPVLAAFNHRPVARPFMASPITHTTYAHFSPSCPESSNTAHVTDIDGDGTITLAANFADDFPGSPLNSTFWESGLWAGGGYVPTISSGILTINANDGAWVRSVSPYLFTYGTVEFTAEFGSGANQHIGFGSTDFSGNGLFIFSTKTGDGNLYARVNNNVSEQFDSLGAIPAGMHRYRIVWANSDVTNDLISFYMDGVFKFGYTVVHSGATSFHAYISNNGALDLKVDNIQVTPTYKTSGEFISCALDAGAGNVWDNIGWVENKPANTGVTVQVSTSDDGTAFGAFTNATSGLSFGGQLHRYLKYKLILSTTDTSASPRVDSVSLNDVVATATPTITPTNTPGPSPTPTPLPAATMNFPSSGNTPPGTRPLFDWANITSPSLTSYTFQLSTNSSFTMLVMNVNVSVSAYTPTADLPRNTILYWRVRGNAGGKPGLWSRTRYFYSANPPGVPMLISPANSANITITTLKPTLDWGDSSPAAAYYEVQISKDINFGVLLGRGQGGVAQLSAYTVETELITGTVHHWRVRAVNINGGTAQVSQWSAQYSFRTP